jgi:hypothetical protein
MNRLTPLYALLKKLYAALACFGGAAAACCVPRFAAVVLLGFLGITP